MTLISQLPFIEREIGFTEPVDPNRSVRANDHEWVKKTLIIPHVVLFSYTSTFFGKHQLKIPFKKFARLYQLRLQRKYWL